MHVLYDRASPTRAMGVEGPCGRESQTSLPDSAEGNVLTLSRKVALGAGYVLSKMPVSAALASVLKCSWKPTIAADVSAVTGRASSFTANTVKT